MNAPQIPARSLFASRRNRIRFRQCRLREAICYLVDTDLRLAKCPANDAGNCFGIKPLRMTIKRPLMPCKTKRLAENAGDRFAPSTGRRVPHNGGQMTSNSSISIVISCSLLQGLLLEGPPNSALHDPITIYAIISNFVIVVLR